MFYSIRHLTKFLYDHPVSESMMETRMHPRSDQNQRCLTFHLSVSPRCRVFSYRDHLANHIHHFDIPGQHGQLVIVAEALVEVTPHMEVPSFLAPDAWDHLDRMVHEGDYYEFLHDSEYCMATPLLDELAARFDVRRRDDPLMLLHELNRNLFEYFDYKPRSTKVDSPIDVALTSRHGVCQDFAHVMITLVRTKLRMPCRYVSGYLAHRESPVMTQTLGNMTQSMPAMRPMSQTLGSMSEARRLEIDRSSASATHAWVEVLMPHLGWVGFDPTNWLVAGDRHIRTAIGRDYADVPPTHGMFRGRAKSELTVAVRVTPTDGAPNLEQEMPVPEDWSILVEKAQALPDQPPPLSLLQQMAQQQQ